MILIDCEIECLIKFLIPFDLNAIACHQKSIRRLCNGYKTAVTTRKSFTSPEDKYIAICYLHLTKQNADRHESDNLIVVLGSVAFNFWNGNLKKWLLNRLKNT